ncbi:hypothetical protein JXI42_14420 [bacterium]|nr:hypothetical protein [bacterium]
MDKSKFNIKKEWRKFGIGLAIILCILATIQLIVGKSIFIYFYFSGAVILLVALILPILLKPVFILFSYISFGMGWVMTRVLLSILFYTVFTLISLISRLFGKRFIDLKIDKNLNSYWRDKKPVEDNVSNYENQF